MKISNFLDDLSIHWAIGGHKHTQDGWVNFPCPFCSGGEGLHMGYNVDGDFFSCWRCGGHPVIKVVKELHNCSWKRAGEIIKQYHGTTYVAKKEVELAEETMLPEGTGDLLAKHRKYLIDRNFDPDELERVWELRGTGRKGRYANRIIAPIYHRGELVSYQGRDITDVHDLKYKACPKDGEVLEHKHTVYGLDMVRGDNIVIVEGITDAWRLGRGAVATFGIKFKAQQVALLRQFKHRFIFYDFEPQARAQAEKLYHLLCGFPGYTEIIDIQDGDPGELSQSDADDIMLELVGKY